MNAHVSSILLGVRTWDLYVEHLRPPSSPPWPRLVGPEPSEYGEQTNPSAAARQLHRHDVLGGLIHEYERAA
jgi:hypothetical protein